MATVALGSKAGKWIMVSTIMASAMAFIDATALNVVLPSLQKSLNASGTDLFWILNAYLLMLTALILIGGSLGDKLGRKKVFMAGIFLFILGSAACGFAPGVTLLIVFRMLQGIGGALMIPGSLSLISSSINPNERGKAIGTWSAFTTVVTMGGPVLGGAFGDAGLWRYIFFINIPIGIVALIILAKQVKEIRDENSKQGLDIAGAVAIALGLAAVTFGFLRIPAVGLNNWQVYASLGGGLLLLLAFIIIEKKGRHPMMPLQLFTNITFSGANLLTFFLYAGLGAGMLFLGLNMVQVQGYSQLQSGLTFLPFTVLMIVIARFAGALADKHGPRLFLIVGPACAGAGLLILSFVKQTAGPAAYWTTFFPGILVFGLGMSFTVAPLTAAVMSSVSDHFSGTASGVNNALTRIANVFANAILGALAVLFFSGALQGEIKNVKLNDKQKQLVIKQAVNLGNAKAPEVFNEQDKATIAKAYKESFIAAYANIMRISAGLAFLGAIMSVMFIRNSAVKKG
ncbi:DHA2 family efflux MFS transporter permease subunit [Mucilaginibacter terrigena]|uniref:DHA2 family efflux MFS transporter permease subunit n=1 Tax=Mucilaginibacter terrigena TaxID=2492395 RepID=A0A4Q5LRN1_9SPHI|nr:MFS transporter [Mucilaginibacter terrigena]RYU92135.1 DHA2 family efflux MFS transporter permease subunit [Mucilaginibacter terrigena]